MTGSPVIGNRLLDLANHEGRTTRHLARNAGVGTPVRPRRQRTLHVLRRTVTRVAGLVCARARDDQCSIGLHLRLCHAVLAWSLAVHEPCTVATLDVDTTRSRR